MSFEREALEAILEMCDGWDDPITSVERVLVIKDIARVALNNPGVELNDKAAAAFDLVRRSKLAKEDGQNELAADLLEQAKAVWV